MGQHTEIQWADSTVSPVSGCQGCELWLDSARKGPCYAGFLHETRLAKSLPHLYDADFTKVRMIPGRMAKAAAWSDLAGKDRADKPWLNSLPRIIFVEDLGDLFSHAVPFEFIKAELVDVALSPKGRRHVWMCLTKRPTRMAEFGAWLRETHGMGWPVNVWAGTSVTNLKTANRVGHLLRVPAAIRFVSLEPLREYVPLVLDETPHQSEVENPIHLAIIGGESKQGSHQTYPFDLDWARRLIAGCHRVGIKPFMKQLGSVPFDSKCRISISGPDSHAIQLDLRDSHGGDWSEWDADLCIRDFPEPVLQPV